LENERNYLHCVQEIRNNSKAESKQQKEEEGIEHIKIAIAIMVVAIAVTVVVSSVDVEVLLSQLESSYVTNGNSLST